MAANRLLNGHKVGPKFYHSWCYICTSLGTWFISSPQGVSSRSYARPAFLRAVLHCFIMCCVTGLVGNCVGDAIVHNQGSNMSGPHDPAMVKVHSLRLSAIIWHHRILSTSVQVIFFSFQYYSDLLSDLLPRGINYNKIWSKIWNFCFKKMHLKMTSAPCWLILWRPLYSGILSWNVGLVGIKIYSIHRRYFLFMWCNASPLSIYT